MKVKIIHFLIALLFAPLCTSIQLSASFNHPGILNSKLELDYIRERVNADSNNVTKQGYRRMINGWEPANNPSHDHNPPSSLNKAYFENQGLRHAHTAYAHALQYVITGDIAYRDSAKRILNRFGETQPNIGNNGDDQLRAAFFAPIAVAAAEIVKHYKAPDRDFLWAEQEIEAFNAFLDNIYDSVVKILDPSRPVALGNWGQSAACSLMAIGIFQDDPIRFTRGFLNNRDLQQPLMIQSSGKCYASSRDFNHEQRVFELSALAAEISYQQGYNLFADRFEEGDFAGWPKIALHAYMVSRCHYLDPHPASELENASPSRNNGFGWESVLSAYKTRAAPLFHGISESGNPDPTYTRSLEEYVVDKWRPHLVNLEHPGFSTLTHAELPYFEYAQAELAPVELIFPTPSNEIEWETIHPGAGGNIMSFNADPSLEGVVYMNTDVVGTYKSEDNGDTFHFIGEGSQHAMAFHLAASPSDSQTLYQGNLYGLDRSSDGGKTWDPIELPVIGGKADEGDSIAWILIDPTSSLNVFAAPGWKMKDSQKSQVLSVDQALSGPRTLYTSEDGLTFAAETYETQNGYRQIYNMAFRSPTQTDQVIIGAHSGVYLRDGSNVPAVYHKLPEPNGIASGMSETRKVGGNRGVATSPDGRWLYGLWVVDASGNKTKLYSYDLENGVSGSWTQIDFPLPEVEWAYPQIDPRSDSTTHTLLVGQLSGQHKGLWEGQISYDQNGDAAISSDWDIVGGTNNQDNRFTYSQGWTNVDWSSHAFLYTPATWSKRHIFALGANNYFRGETERSGWPYQNAWFPIYTDRLPNTGGAPAYTHNGAADTVNWDMAHHQNYVAQSMADEGFAESYDEGLSWYARPNIPGVNPKPNRSNAVTVIETGGNAPLVLTHLARGYGTIPNNGGLYAKYLVNYDYSDTWKLVGGINFPSHSTSTANQNGKNGLVSAVYQDIESAPSDPKVVYIATDERGVYRTDDIFSLVANDSSPFYSVTDGTLLANKFVHHIQADPNNADILYCVGGYSDAAFYILDGSNGSWSATMIDLVDYTGNPSSQSDFNNPTELAVWEHEGQTYLALSRNVGDEGDVIVSKDSGQTWAVVGTVTDMMATLSALPNWYVADKDGFDSPEVRTVAARGNELYVSVAQNAHRRSFGVFRGMLGDGSTDWVDITGTGEGRLHYAKSQRSKIYTHLDGNDYLYLATDGTGTVRSNLDALPEGNLLQNGNFEAPSLSPWNYGGAVSISTDSASNGNQSLMAKVDTPSFVAATQTVAIQPDTFYIFKAKLKTAISNDGYARLRVFYYDSLGNEIDSHNGAAVVSSEFIETTINVETPSNAATATLHIQLFNGVGTLYADEAQLIPYGITNAFAAHISKGSSVTPPEPEPEPEPSNLLVNGDFETGEKSPWTGGNPMRITTSNVANGNYAFEIYNNAAATYRTSSQRVAVSAVTDYIFKASISTDLSVGAGRVIIDLYDSGNVKVGSYTSPFISGVTPYSSQELEIATTSDTAEIDVRLQLFEGTGSVFFDDVTLVSKTVAPPEPEPEPEPEPDLNLLSNGTFETGSLSPWSSGNAFSVAAGEGLEGSYAVRINNGGSPNYRTTRQTVAAEEYVSYSLTAYAKTQLTAGTARVVIDCLDEGGNIIEPFFTQSVDGAGDYVPLEAQFIAPQGTVSVTVKLQMFEGSGTIYFDNIALLAGDRIEPEPFEGDVDGDNQLTANDLLAMRTLIGKTSDDPAYNPAADLDADGAITRNDYSLLYALVRASM